MNKILIWNLFWDCTVCRSVAVVSLLTPGQVKFEEFQRATGTGHSSLSLINLTCKNSKIASDVTAPLRVTRSIKRTFPVLSQKPSESVKTKISTAHISKTKTNFSNIPSKLFSGLQNLVIEINLSRRFS